MKKSTGWFISISVLGRVSILRLYTSSEIRTPISSWPTLFIIDIIIDGINLEDFWNKDVFPTGLVKSSVGIVEENF